MNYDVYIDLDGVLADFEGHYLKLFGHRHDSVSKNAMWKNVNSVYANGHEWYSELPLMPGTNELLRGVMEVCDQGFMILTAAGSHEVFQRNAYEKTDWIRNHGMEVPTLVVPKGTDKAVYANTHAILIDDTDKVLNAWAQAGGIPIKHVSVERTLKQLHNLYGRP